MTEAQILVLMVGGILIAICIIVGIFATISDYFSSQDKINDLQRQLKEFEEDDFDDYEEQNEIEMLEEDLNECENKLHQIREIVK